MQKFSFHFSDTFWLEQKLYHHEQVCPGWIQKFGEFILLFFMEDFEMFDYMILLIILFLQWGVTEKYKLFKLLVISIALFSTSNIMKKL